MRKRKEEEGGEAFGVVGVASPSKVVNISRRVLGVGSRFSAMKITLFSVLLLVILLLSYALYLEEYHLHQPPATAPVNVLCIVKVESAARNESARANDDFERLKVQLQYLTGPQGCDQVLVVGFSGAEHELTAAVRRRVAAAANVDAAAPVTLLLLPSSIAVNHKHWHRRRRQSRYALRHVLINNDLFVQSTHLLMMRTDTAVNIDNLRLLLQPLQTTLPQYLGHYLIHTSNVSYHYALTAYVVNRRFLELLGASLKRLNDDAAIDSNGIDGGVLCNLEPELDESSFHTEDDMAGLCLRSLALYPNMTRDVEQRDYFFPFQSNDHRNRMLKYVDDWYWRGKSKKSVGANCCALQSIAFGNYDARQLQRILNGIEEIWKIEEAS